ncbi:hypothetical protein KM043_005026 [Ampulex compressa]|nr:hypothetical protein KM043_005026 [Ampulex compressa]
MEGGEWLGTRTDKTRFALRNGLPVCDRSADNRRYRRPIERAVKRERKEGDDERMDGGMQKEERVSPRGEGRQPKGRWERIRGSKYPGCGKSARCKNPALSRPQLFLLEEVSIRVSSRIRKFGDTSGGKLRS